MNEVWSNQYIPIVLITKYVSNYLLYLLSDVCKNRNLISQFYGCSRQLALKYSPRPVNSR